MKELSPPSKYNVIGAAGIHRFRATVCMVSCGIGHYEITLKCPIPHHSTGAEQV